MAERLDNRIMRCRAVLDWYERHGFPEDIQTAVNALTAILTGELPEQPEETENRLDALERAVSVLAERLSPPETSAPQNASSGVSPYHDLLFDLRRLRDSLAAHGMSASEHVALGALDQILDQYEDEVYNAEGNIQQG